MHTTRSTRLLLPAAALLAAATTLNAQWLQLAPATSPTARSGAAMTYDPNSNGLVLFGGSTPGLNGQTWTFNGTDWTQQTPATSPSARFGAQLVHDEARGVSVLYGGLASAISIPPPNSDTWEWNGTTWTQITTPATAGPRYWYGACYDSVRARTVIFGGATTQLLSPPSNQTWEYNGITWTQVTSAGTPGSRNRPAMCYHLGLAKAVLFGGHDGSNFTDSTWTYNGTTWTQVAITGSKPSPRSSASMVYDLARNVCVLHGGQNASGPLADTWTFDGTTWTQQPFTTQAGRDEGLAYFPTLSQTVRFGGFVAAPNTQSNQTWVFGSGIYGSGCVGSNGVPALLATSAPQLGQNYTLNLTNLNPAFSLGFLAFGFTPLPGIDLGAILGMPGCAAFASPDVLLTVSGAGGSANFVWAPVSGPLGAAFFCQCICLDPGANAAGLTISNATFATIAN